jgi:putative ABC transport system substrate-binding protein
MTTGRRAFLRIAGAGFSAWPAVVFSQSSARRPVLGFLLSETLEGQESRLKALRAGLRERGYVEGRNIAVELRSADGDYARLPKLAEELARLKVDVMVAFGSKAVLAARRAAGAIPIVAPVLGDPVAIGVTKSLARPDGNVTGSAILTVELFSKHIQLLKEVAPKTSRVAVFVNPANATGTTESMRVAMSKAKKALGVELESFDLSSPQDITGAFAKIAKGRVDALYVLSDTLFRKHAAEIAQQAARQRLPSVGTREFADAGGLVGYGANDTEMYVRGAYFIDRILRGAKVGDLPIEQATRFELVLNRKTAALVGVSVPQALLLRADRVIE